MPEISVIIPTHNRARLLSRAIASVLRQDYGDLEIIVSADGCTDDSARLVQQITDPRLQYIARTPAEGEAAAVNLGLAQARGRYVAFLHDDDLWYQGKLADQVACLQSADPEVGAIYCGFDCVDEASGAILQTVRPTRRGDLRGALRQRNCVGVPSTMLLRRDCLKAVGGFDEAIVAGADYDLWIRLAHRYRFDFIDKPLVRYSVHDDRLSANWSRVIAGAEAMLAKHRSFFAGDRKHYSRQLYNLGVLYCLVGRSRAGRVALRQAIARYPFDPRYYFRWLLTGLPTFQYQKLQRYRQRWAA